jgi:hypothetical protein
MYTGAKTPMAIKSRLRRERSNGDRWAYAMIETETTHPQRISDDNLAVVLAK